MKISLLLVLALTLLATCSTKEAIDNSKTNQITEYYSTNHEEISRYSSPNDYEFHMKYNKIIDDVKREQMKYSYEKVKRIERGLPFTADENDEVTREDESSESTPTLGAMLREFIDF
ncbi:hypothetical protein ACM26V_02320 [Salipaludibacillus sp. HK11]|uniref:hypothetical protein n=1 Tax=Salipaludibacillus sp. HK11 TaxID=3394320 RepID=UPI0039FCFB42